MRKSISVYFEDISSVIIMGTHPPAPFFSSKEDAPHSASLGSNSPH